MKMFLPFKNMMTQVGPPEDGYRLTVGGFNREKSTLGDSFTINEHMLRFGWNWSYEVEGGQEGGWATISGRQFTAK